jgi:predicted ArsR family transcriptional regulator
VVNDQWSVVVALADASRRSLYDYVRRQDHPVAREEAADATGMSRNLAAFHLDKLVETGLLAARYEAPPGRPRGRGRAPKVYETVGDGLTVTVPARRYELIAEILADAVAESPSQSFEAALELAAARGREVGQELRNSGRDLLAGLTDLGFEPELQSELDEQPDLVLLRNCPFHALAGRQTALVCGLNHRFLQGLVDGLRAERVEANLAPRSGACCVELVSHPSR